MTGIKWTLTAPAKGGGNHRYPLNAVFCLHWYGAGIAKPTADSDDKNGCIGKTEEASRHLPDVVSNALDATNIEFGKLELDLSGLGFGKMPVRVANAIISECG